ncbi:ATP-binding protein [Desulfocicer niacini]
MMLKLKKIKGVPGLSPLVIIGIFAILVPIFVLMTIDNIREQNGRIKEKLTGKGLLLIRAFEAGTRTGMITTRWGGKRVQRLLAETAEQPEIEYMMITDRRGLILAHSDENQVGKRYEGMPDMVFEQGLSPLFHREVISPGGVKVFEVYKEFTPARRHFRSEKHPPPPGCAFDVKGNAWRCPPSPSMDDVRKQHASRSPDKDWFQSHFSPDDGGADSREQVIFAAINMKEIEQIKQRAVTHAIFMGCLFLALGVVGVVCVVALQGYRSARSSLSRIKAFSDDVIANMPAGLITVNIEMEITSSNGAALEILGYEKHTSPMRLPPEMKALVDKIKGSPPKVAGEIGCTVHGDHQLLLDVTVSSILSEGENLSGYLFLFHDLTQFKAMKDEVDRNRRLAAVGKLAAGVAHEIRNPLSSIKGFATWFLERYEQIPEDREVAGIMIQEVERLNRAVTQLLEFARPMPVVKKRVKLSDIIDHSLRLIAPDVKKQQIQLKTCLDTGVVWLHTDPDRLNQILLNLYLNALQAMETMGRLCVTVTDGRQRGAVVIEVADTGRGIPQGDVDKIFDPYFTTRSDGTGLGLAMVYRSLEALGGAIRVESTPGSGTRFFIELHDVI